MKIESKMLENTDLQQKIIDSINQYIEDIKKEYGSEDLIDIIELRINMSSNTIYVKYSDKTDDANVINDILSKATEIKNKILSSTNDVEKAILSVELAELNKKYKELTGLDLSVVI